MSVCNHEYQMQLMKRGRRVTEDTGQVVGTGGAGVRGCEALSGGVSRSGVGPAGWEGGWREMMASGGGG